MTGFQGGTQPNVLIRLRQTPRVSQHALDKNLGVGLGIVNFCFQVLMKRVWSRCTAGITCGEKLLLQTKNKSTYILFGELLRLGSPGSIPLEFIGAQSGSYLGEGGIVRFEDLYGRSKA